MFGKLKFKKNVQPTFSRRRKLKTNLNSGPTVSKQTRKSLTRFRNRKRKKDGYIMRSVLRALSSSPILRAFVYAPNVCFLDGISAPHDKISFFSFFLFLSQFFTVFHNGQLPIHRALQPLHQNPYFLF